MINIVFLRRSIQQWYLRRILPTSCHYGIRNFPVILYISVVMAQIKNNPQIPMCSEVGILENDWIMEGYTHQCTNPLMFIPELNVLLGCDARLEEVDLWRHAFRGFSTESGPFHCLSFLSAMI